MTEETAATDGPDRPGSSSGGGSILVVGEALVDLVIASDGTVSAALGGAPFNAARTCGRLEASVEFIGALSTDRFGTMLRSQLVADGVGTDGAIDVESPTTLAAAELDEAGVATYRFYVEGTSVPSAARICPGGDPPAVVLTGGLALVLEPLADAVAAFVAGTRPSRTGASQVAAATGPPGRAMASAPMVMVDVNCRPRVIADRARYLARLGDVVARADVVKVSDEDLAYLAPDRPPVEAARQVLATGPPVVLLTAGDAAVIVLAGGEERSVPVAAVQVVDTIGAGDAFTGGFCAWWSLTGRSPQELADPDAIEAAVRAAVAVAGVACTRRGAEPPWRHDLPASWSSV